MPTVNASPISTLGGAVCSIANCGRVQIERLVAAGELEALKVQPPRKGYRAFAVCMGVIAMAIGTTLVVLIILAGLNWI